MTGFNSTTHFLAMQMQNWCYGVALSSWLILGGALVTSSNSAVAQIVPDETLPNNSTVTTQDNIRTITGGTQAASNLFHSFEEFSVSRGSTAYFKNASDIQNIITRVTGKSISNIDGILKANGNANLFFMNPNGIIFGRDAKLDIGGSFLATTANAIEFGNQGLFSASTPEAPSSLLSVNPSALLFNQIAAASIQNNSVAPSGLDPSRTFTATGLRVPNGQSLLLVDANISMDRGGLYAFGGRVELGGLAGAGTVGLNRNGSQFSLSFPDGVGRGDVSLTNRAIVNVRADNGGSIAINARNLEMAGESELLAGIADELGSVNSKAGNIEVNAQEAVNLKDESGIRNFVQSRAIGQGGDVRITAGSLSLTSGSLIFTTTYGRGDAGNVTIIARDTVFSDGLRSNASGVYSSVLSRSVGNGGDISITTGSLSFTNGAVLITSNNGLGDAGSITINARERVSFNGVGRYGRFTSASGVYSSIIPQVVGNGGDITITTGSLTVRNGARLSARTFGYGNAGSITITARDNVSFDGVGIRGSSGAFSSVEPGAVGKAGGISVTTDSLNVQNGAQLNASNEGQGFTGEINVRSASIQLDNQALIQARTASGNGGNIALGFQDLLVLRRGSQISTTAGTAKAGGNGGNININAPNGFLVTVADENSDITANAFTGSGGRVQIQASGLFGIQQRSREDLVRQLGSNNPSNLDPQKLETNDITAISQINPDLSGVVNINTPYVEPNQGLINLPVKPTEPKLALGCSANVAQNESEFIITGRGGIPANPREVLKSHPVHVDWVALDSDVESHTTDVQSNGTQQRQSGENITESTNSVKSIKNEIVEAQGWVMDANGDVFLVAQPPTAMPHSSWFTPTACSEETKFLPLEPIPD